MTPAPAPAAVPAADAHNDLLMLVEHFRDDPGYFRRNWLPQLQAGQVRTQVLPVYVGEEFLPELALRQTLRLIETALAAVMGGNLRRLLNETIGAGREASP